MPNTDVRPEFTRMLEDEGCPECGSVNTSEMTLCVSGYPDDQEACHCDDCSHYEFKYPRQEMVVHYFDRKANKMVDIVVPSDCLQIKLPDQEGKQNLAIEVNTDTMALYQNSQVVARYDYDDLLAERDSDR